MEERAMDMTDVAIHLTLSVFLIVGAYQFYFWCQRRHLAEARQLWLPVDEWIPFRPGWVWIYSFLYYPAILYTNLVIDSADRFTRVAISYLVLLGLQMTFFLFFPVVTPEAWRARNTGRSPSERFLAFVQRLDARSNSFPSMHTSVATLTALHLYPSLGGWALGFPLLIGLSCLFTKQHYVVDVPTGAALGWVAFEAFRWVA
jgi:membrane-associated phospholipid phosphatase